MRPEGDEDDEDDRAGDEDEDGDGDEDEQSEADSAFMGDDDSDASDEYAPSVASAGHVEKIAAAEAGEASEQRLMGREDHRTLAGVTKLAAARSRARAKESWLNDERDKVLLDMPRVARPKLTRIERASIAPKRLYCVGAMLHRTPELAYADGTRNPISLRRRPIGRVERFLATDWRPSGVRPRTEAADVFSSPDGTATPGRGAAMARALVARRAPRTAGLSSRAASRATARRQLTGEELAAGGVGGSGTGVFSETYRVLRSTARASYARRALRPLERGARALAARARVEVRALLRVGAHRGVVACRTRGRADFFSIFLPDAITLAAHADGRGPLYRPPAKLTGRGTGAQGQASEGHEEAQERQGRQGRRQER